MSVNSEMVRAEIEIRAVLAGDVGPAMTALFAAYSARTPAEKDAFVAVLIGHVTAAEGLRRTRAA